jgi:hypothetical protein
MKKISHKDTQSGWHPQPKKALRVTLWLKNQGRKYEEFLKKHLV